jgi:hypothetical protein
VGLERSDRPARDEPGLWDLPLRTIFKESREQQSKNCASLLKVTGNGTISQVMMRSLRQMNPFYRCDTEL